MEKKKCLIGKKAVEWGKWRFSFSPLYTKTFFFPKTLPVFMQTLEIQIVDD